MISFIEWFIMLQVADGRTTCQIKYTQLMQTRYVLHCSSQNNYTFNHSIKKIQMLIELAFQLFYFSCYYLVLISQAIQSKTIIKIITYYHMNTLLFWNLCYIKSLSDLAKAIGNLYEKHKILLLFVLFNCYKPKSLPLLTKK